MSRSAAATGKLLWGLCRLSDSEVLIQTWEAPPRKEHFFRTLRKIVKQPEAPRFTLSIFAPSAVLLCNNEFSIKTIVIWVEIPLKVLAIDRKHDGDEVRKLVGPPSDSSLLQQPIIKFQARGLLKFN